MDSSLSPKITIKKAIPWIALFVIGVLSFLTWRRIQWIKSANMPTNLLEGVNQVNFGYNSSHLEPLRDTSLYLLKEADRAIAEKAIAARPKTYIAGSESDTIQEEFPSADFLFAMDSDIYRAVQASIQNKGLSAVGAGGVQIPTAKSSKIIFKSFTTIETSASPTNLPSTLSRISVNIYVVRRFESGKCLFYVYASLDKPVTPISPRMKIIPTYAQPTLLMTKPRLIVVGKQEAESAIQQEVLGAVSLLLKEATHFTETTEVTNE